MKPFMLLIDEEKLKALDLLVSSAGSRLGDITLMNLATDVRRWLQAEMQNAAKQAEAAESAVAKSNGNTKKEPPTIEAEAVQ